MSSVSVAAINPILSQSSATFDILSECSRENEFEIEIHEFEEYIFCD